MSRALGSAKQRRGRFFPGKHTTVVSTTELPTQSYTTISIYAKWIDASSSNSISRYPFGEIGKTYE